MKYQSSTEKERYREFGSYLREVLRQRGWVSSEELDAVAPEEVVEKFRFCGCGAECYSKADERQAILEFDSLSDTLAVLELATKNHGKDHDPSLN